MKTTPWYRQWMLANAFAELLGLGGSAVLLYGLASLLDETALKGLAVLAGTLIEGSAVGLLQGLLLREHLQISTKVWWLATVAGAGIAWICGMLPSLLMDFSSGTEPASEPPLLLILLLAAVMGLILGIFLAAPQAWVLRQHGHPRPGGWIRYNMLAWMLGMPVIFAGIQTVEPQASLWRNCLNIGLSLLLAGALVGLVHGRFFMAPLPTSEANPVPNTDPGSN